MGKDFNYIIVASGLTEKELDNIHINDCNEIPGLRNSYYGPRGYITREEFREHFLEVVVADDDYRMMRLLSEVLEEMDDDDYVDIYYG